MSIYFLDSFEECEEDRQQVVVRVTAKEGVSCVMFHSSPELDKNNLLCKLHFKLSPPEGNFKV